MAGPRIEPRGQRRNIYAVFINFLSNPTTLAVFKIFIGGLFLLSSVTKIPDPAKFSESVAAYKILPQVFIMPAAYLFPLLQAIAGLFLILDVYAQSSAFILSGLLVVYIIAISSAWARGINIDCGCFDLLTQFGLEDKVGLKAIIRDVIFLLFSGSIFLFDKNSLSFYGIKKLFKGKGVRG